jgi:16S rRNA (guanine1207-N2)-methyltransferase
MAQARSQARGRRQDSAPLALIACLDQLDLKGRVLLIADDAREIVAAIEAQAPDCDVHTWCRRLTPTGQPVSEASAWLPQGPFDAAFVRLPSVRAEQEMTLHAAAARTRAGGAIVVFGANTEGIKTNAGRMEKLLGPTTVLSVKHHARVLRAIRPNELEDLKGQLSDWRQTSQIRLNDRERDWVSYPGLFAHGRLDEGSELLIEALPDIGSSARILDFGCGSGMIAAAVRQRQPDAHVDLLDIDALALESARENVPSGRLLLGRDLKTAATDYTLIVSNPTLHDGVAEDHSVVDRLIAEAPHHLTTRGSLLFVVQRRIPLERTLKETFANIDVVKETGRFRVWRAEAARSVQATSARRRGRR